MTEQKLDQNVRWRSSMDEARRDLFEYRVNGKDREALTKGWERLPDELPESERARRAGFIRSP